MARPHEEIVPRKRGGSQSADSELLRAALDYHQRGWSLLPLILTDEKIPKVRWKKYQSQRANEAKLRGWFTRKQGISLGVIFGPVSSGLGSRDFDDLERYHAWARSFPELAAELPTVETSRGRHVYFRADQEQVAELRRLLGKPENTGAIACGDGELRIGPGCYSALPPSRHGSGHVYRWLIPLGDELKLVDLLSSGFVPEHLLAGSHSIGAALSIAPDCSDLSTDDSPAGSSWGRNGNPVCSENSESVITEADQADQTGQETPPKLSPPLHTSPELHALPAFTVLHREPGNLSSWVTNGEVELALARTTPSGYGQRRDCLFKLARELKALPALAAAPVRELQPIVRRWHEAALPSIRLKPFEDNWFAFMAGWRSVKWPAGRGPLADIFTRASRIERTLALDYEQEELRVLVAACRLLQQAAGTKPFFLDSRSAGQYLGIHHVKAWRWLTGLCDEGVLRLAERGSRKEHKANSYFYVDGDSEILNAGH